jgi:hypothetical protein
MFRNLAQLFATNQRPKTDVFLVHPLQLGRWLDEAWAAAAAVPPFGPSTGQAPFLGSTDIVSELDLPAPVAGVQPPVPSGLDLTNPDVFTGATFPASPPLIWDHLVYAYLIESTGVFEVMAEVLRRLVVGETLNSLSAKGLRWVRATEELFFRDPPLFAIGGITSQLRPDLRVARRNAYWRMFAFEPSHSIPPRWRPPSFTGDEAWKADTGSGVNTGFREKWVELLRQVWLGIENAKNGIGPNATDREYVAFLCKAIKDMLNMRRRGGQLAREEFVHVTTMSWFHLTLESDSPIVLDLKAEATNTADRLAKIAQLVGMAPAARSRELFELSELMSALLRAIELGLFDSGAQAETLYLPVGTNAKLLEDMNKIIDLWQSAAGERVKDRVVTAVSGTSAQPVRLPSPSPSPTRAPVPVGAAAGNGFRS